MLMLIRATHLFQSLTLAFFFCLDLKDLRAGHSDI